MFWFGNVRFAVSGVNEELGIMSALDKPLVPGTNSEFPHNATGKSCNKPVSSRVTRQYRRRTWYLKSRGFMLVGDTHEFSQLHKDVNQRKQHEMP